MGREVRADAAPAIGVVGYVGVHGEVHRADGAVACLSGEGEVGEE